MNLQLALLLVLINTSSASAESFDKVLTTLYSIKQQNLLSQHEADSEIFTLESQCETLLASSYSYQSEQQESLATSHKNYDSALQTLENFAKNVDFLSESLKSAQESYNAFMQLRCQETTIFLQNLKDSKEALDLIQYMQIDVEKFYGTKNSEFVKLGAKISELVGGENSDEILQSRTDEGIKEVKMMVWKNIEKLEEKELKAARDFVAWQVLAKKANEKVDKEVKEKQEGLKKLESDVGQAKKELESAQIALDHAKSLWESQSIECESQKNTYLVDKASRENDFSLIEETIKIFEKQVRQVKELANSLNKE